jgi:arylsulfatase
MLKALTIAAALVCATTSAYAQEGGFDLANRPNPLAGLTSFTYGPGVGFVQESAAINTHRGFSVTAEIESGPGAADGVLAAMGGKTAGWSLYLRDGRPVFYYNFFGLEAYEAAAPEALPEGRSTVSVEVEPEEEGYGKPAMARLLVNGEEVATVRVERTVPVGYSGEGLDVGADNISAVSPDYVSPYAYGGRIEGVTIAVEE